MSAMPCLPTLLRHALVTQSSASLAGGTWRASHGCGMPIRYSSGKRRWPSRALACYHALLRSLRLLPAPLLLSAREPLAVLWSDVELYSAPAACGERLRCAIGYAFSRILSVSCSPSRSVQLYNHRSDSISSLARAAATRMVYTVRRTRTARPTSRPRVEVTGTVLGGADCGGCWLLHQSAHQHGIAYVKSFIYLSTVY